MSSNSSRPGAAFTCFHLNKMASGNEVASQQTAGLTEPHGEQLSVGRNILEEFKAEKNALDPSFVHCIRLIDAEIHKLTDAKDPTKAQKEKIYISFDDQKTYNLVGRLLGPKGLTLKRIQAETATKMSILGRGSIKEKSKEDELRNSGNLLYAHLNDELHVLIEAVPPNSVQKLAAGATEVRKMLIPPEPGVPDYSSKYEMPAARGPSYGAPSRGGPGYRWEFMHGGPPGRPRGRGRPREDRRSGSGSLPSPATPEAQAAWSDDQWRDGTISKDYNHGVMSAGGAATTGYTNEERKFSAPPTSTTSEGYFSDFSDTGANDSRNGHEWKAGHSASSVRDYRYHPYDNPPPTGY